VAGTASEGFYNKDGTLIEWKVKALARSYLMSSQGVLTQQHFDAKSGELRASFTADTSI